MIDRPVLAEPFEGGVIPAIMIPEIFPGTDSIIESRDSAAFKVMAYLRRGRLQSQRESHLGLGSGKHRARFLFNNRQ
ncbi:MAG: hypothetical protein WD733_00730 [Bryobacterales bacterium]